LPADSCGSDASTMHDYRENRQKRFERFIRKVRAKGLRKENAERNKRSSIIFGLGMIGMVGWAVTIPTLAGIALGIWIDRTWPSTHSWTLILLFAGIILGCLNAWYWVQNSLGRTGDRRERR